MKIKHLKTANAIRALSIDAIQKANSGHPGAPMGMADIADILWRKYLKHNPGNPNWQNRDRFILSNGHASMLLYSLLYLSGYDLSIDEIINFRQLDSKTPGHPEFGHTCGVETTTGPLGQGLANAVGFALAEKILAQRFNRPEFPIIDHHTYVFAGDGCLMEGISHEACSLAGTWKLNKLILFYDSNEISIDGNTQNWFSDNHQQRFQSYGWNVINDIDGHNIEEIENAIVNAKCEQSRPTIIICKTNIGQGSPNMSGSEKTHGSPLGEKEIQATRENIKWHNPPFEIPSDVIEKWDFQEKGKHLEQEWDILFKNYSQKYPELAAELKRRFDKKLPANFEYQNLVNKIREITKPIATRRVSQMCIEFFSEFIPELIGGSADLAGSNLTETKHSIDLMNNFDANNISFGVREFGMCAIATGISLHQGFKVYAATFLVFSDYARNAIRMAALMEQPIIYIFTHDSIGLGEDGPTHQPIEQLPSLRLIPNVNVWRPADAIETAIAWQQAISSTKTPNVLALSRQSLNQLNRTSQQEKDIAKGGYVISDCQNPKAVIIATGSEVELAISVKVELDKKGINIKIVSMPCAEVFSKQNLSYQQQVLPDGIPRLAIEAAQSQYWKGWAGLTGKVIGIDTYGYSAPAEKLFSKFGFTTENIIKEIKKII